MNTEQIQDIRTAERCSHCQDLLRVTFSDSDGNQFCCHGCLSVYEILKSNGLSRFYDIQKQLNPNDIIPTGDESHKKFDYLKDETFLRDYITTQNRQASMSFYLSGIHCIACIWLIENLQKIEPSIDHSRVNLSESTVVVTLKENQFDFSRVAQTLSQLGHTPHPLRHNDDILKLSKKEDKSQLLKIGIAGFSAMNIMLYTGSIYAGADSSTSQNFGFISMALCSPVVFYSALPFYKSAIGAIRNQSLNIDIPLALAVILGFIFSCYFIWIGEIHHYFDSIATLTFLILLSRFGLRKVQKLTLSKDNLTDFFSTVTIKKVKKISNPTPTEIHPKQLQVGDLILVEPGEMIPADGIIAQGETLLNLASLNGESQAIPFRTGQPVLMGSVNQSNNIIILVKSIGDKTNIGKMIKELSHQFSKSSYYTLLTNQIIKYFVSTVLLLSASVLIYFSLLGEFTIGLQRSLALIIVSCPCALGLATPLTFTRMFNLARKSGILLRNEEALEKVSRIDSLFFDKTGTLTRGTFEVSHFDILQEPLIKEVSIEDLVFSLESRSTHPIAKSLKNWSLSRRENLTNISWESWQETIGVGPEALFKENVYALRALNGSTDSLSTQIGLFENNQKIASFKLNDIIRAESSEVLKNLRATGRKVYLSSGDKKDQVAAISKELGFKEGNYRAELSAKEKSEWVSQHPLSMFIGDGVNDTLAFSKAYSSIAVNGSVELGLKVADAFLIKDSLTCIENLFKISDQTIKTIKINLIISIFYNVFGAALAIAGIVTPITAAILMPLSSASVVGSTLWFTRERNGTNGNH